MTKSHFCLPPGSLPFVQIPFSELGHTHDSRGLDSQEIMDSDNDEGTSMGGRRQLSFSSLTYLQHISPNPWPGPVLALAVLSAEAILLETMQD